MAWNQGDRAKILKYLGHPFQQGAVQLVQRAMDQVAAIAPDGVEICQDYLRELDKISRELDEARPFAARSFQSGGSSTAQFFRGERMHHPRTEGRRYVGLLAEAMSLQIMRDVFAAGSGQVGRVIRG